MHFRDCPQRLLSEPSCLQRAFGSFMAPASGSFKPLPIVTLPVMGAEDSQGS